MEPECILRGEGVSIGYRLGGRGIKQVHEALSFALRTGELCCLLGPNGAGKSTLLRTVAGTLLPLSGQLSVEGVAYRRTTALQRARMIGVVLTEKTHIGGLRVEEAVALGRYPHTGFFGRLTSDDRRAVKRAMEAVGVDDKASLFMAELSDGERQKVMIAKVLAQQCPVILLDEPTAYLDAVSRIEVMRLLHRLTREEHKTVLLSTHDIEQALSVADRLWLLRRGEPMGCGVTEDLVLNGSLDRYFGRDGIRFDAARGCFGGESMMRVDIGLECDDAVLRHWAENALQRLGYRTVEGQGAVWVRCEAPDRMIVQRTANAERYVCHSFEQLVGVLPPAQSCRSTKIDR